MPPSDTARDADYLDRLRDYYVDADASPHISASAN